MIPTYITTLFLMSGYEMGIYASGDNSPIEVTLSPSGFNWLENDALGGYVYAPERKKVIKLDDIKVDDKGVLLEPLFAVTGVRSIQTGEATNGWVTDWMGESGWADIEREMASLHEAAISNRSKAPDDLESVRRDHWTTVDFIGLWRAVMGHGDWEWGGYPELDHFEYLGQGKVVSVETSTQARGEVR